MAWLKIDDQIPRHQKILAVGPAAAWLWLCGIAHSQSQLTDGFISDAVLPFLGVSRQLLLLAQRLVEAGLWDREEAGYRVHDYLRHNESRADVLRRRQEDADRKKAGVQPGPKTGLRVESERSPTGIRAESEFPRARVPTRPIRK